MLGRYHSMLNEASMRGMSKLCEYRNVFVNLDLLTLENITPDILRFYNGYFNRSVCMTSSGEVKNLINQNIVGLRSFVKFMVIQNTLRTLRPSILSIRMTNDRSAEIRSKISSLDKQISQLSNSSKAPTVTKLEYYLATAQINNITVGNKAEQKLFKMEIYRQLLIILSTTSFMNNLLQSDYVMRIVNEQFTYFMLLLKVYVMQNYIYEKYTNCVVKKIDSDVLFLIGYFNMDKIIKLGE